MGQNEPAAHLFVAYQCQECGFEGDVEIINKTVTCPTCGTVNDVWQEMLCDIWTNTIRKQRTMPILSKSVHAIYQGRSEQVSEKYISASKLKAHYSWLGKDATLSPKDVDDIIDAQPAADVEPVVHGEWQEFDTDMNAYSCSACNEPQMFIEGNPEQNEYSFCPHCGAHMERSGSGDGK